MDIGSRVQYGEYKGWIVGLSTLKLPIVRWDTGIKTEFLWCLLQEEE